MTDRRPGLAADRERTDAPEPVPSEPRTEDRYPEEAWEGAGRPLFLHPPWTVGVVLVFATVALLLGLGGNPVWLLIGSPFILVLVLWIWARVATFVRSGRDEIERRP
jgi:hypothetical protein